MAALLEGAPRRRVQLDDDLEVQAATTHDALHAHHARRGLDVAQHAVKRRLCGHQRGVVVVLRPLAAPLASDVVSRH